MLFSTISFVVSWICFALFADKKRFFQIMPTCYVAMYLACLTDLLVRDYPLWEYPASTMMRIHVRQMLHEFGIYPIVTFLFIQKLPKVQTMFKLILHIFYWSLLALTIELIAVFTGNMRYGLWWNTWYSYAADWILYGIFYGHYKWRERHIGGENNV